MDERAAITKEQGSSGGTSPLSHAITPLLAARAQIAAARIRREALVAAGQLTGAAVEPAFAPLPMLPGYSLLQLLHRGGQGVVYLARQESTSRQVAVKLLLHGALAAPSELARFQREVEVLSRLKHPNVVTIHDCGRADSGVFLVMDYVDGPRLDEYVRRNAEKSKSRKVEIERTLDLFAKVCDGVNAAHLRGIIHRDLKPSNILVVDGAPEPKFSRDSKRSASAAPESRSPDEVRLDVAEPRILDFGLAKLTSENSESSSAASMTLTGQFLGSLPWASPEQAEGRSDQLDVRTDVYSLGVIFYQLLTGDFPYPVAGRMDEVVRHIAQSAPARPSSVDRWVTGDVETILLKCLAKEPERRYQSAGELGRDIRHYLQGEPIEAKRDSMGYVLRKQLRRHRVAVTVVAAFGLLLAAGLVVSTILWYRAESALAETEAQRKLADQRADQTQAVADFQSRMLSGIDIEAMGRGIKERYRDQVRAALERHQVGEYPNRRRRTPAEIEAGMDQFDTLGSAALGVDVARQVMDDYVLKHAAGAIAEQFTDQPLVQAQLQASIGGAYRSLGLLAAAETQWRSTLETRQAQLGPDHVSIADALNELAMVLQDKADYPAAESAYRESLEMRRRLLGDEHPDVAKSMSNLGNLLRDRGEFQEAEPLVREAMAMQRKLLGEHDVALADALNNFAAMLHTRGKHADAEQNYREAIEILRNEYGPEHDEVVDAASNLGVLLNDRGDYANAERLNREVLALRLKLHGREHRQVARAMNTLAYSLHQQGNLSAAEAIYCETLELRRMLFGDAHPDVGRSLNNLAVVLKDMGHYDEAEPIQREAVELRRELLGEVHPEFISALNNLAVLLSAKGNLDAAESIFRDALDLRRKSRGTDEHPDVARGLANLASAVSRRGDHVQAELLSREALAIRRKVYGDEHPEIATNLNNLAGELMDQGKSEEGELLRHEALAMQRKLLGDAHPLVAGTLHNLATTARKRGQLQNAEQLLCQALSIYQSRYAADHPDIFSTAEQLAGTLIDMNRLEEAEPLIQEALAMSRRKFPGDHRYKAAALSTMALLQFRKSEQQDAVALIDEAVDMILRLHPADHKDSRSILERRVMIVGNASE